jgi:hypothetical protein
MLFERVIDLNDHVIRLGPYTLITIDEGYAAVTQNNGQQKILPGGHVYLLTHRNWKFEKFVTMKIQTNILEQIAAPSADNVLMTVAATINWRISGESLQVFLCCCQELFFPAPCMRYCSY